MKLRLYIFVVVVLSSATLLASNYYKLDTVKRLEQNLYRAKSGTSKLLIETKYCYEMAVGETAILKYDQYSYENRIIFDSGTKCDVAKVVVE